MIKFSKDLKISIFELITKRKFLQLQNNNFLTEILLKFDSILNTLKAQIVYILILKIWINIFISYVEIYN